jgi:hypothetical protein
MCSAWLTSEFRVIEEGTQGAEVLWTQLSRLEVDGNCEDLVTWKINHEMLHHSGLLHFGLGERINDCMEMVTNLAQV